MSTGRHLVVSTQEGHPNMTKTQDIREEVEGELIFDPLVDAADITVKNLNGVVGLNGTVASFPEYLEDGTDRFLMSPS
jgi:osmotically-inducible protein OsmY